MVNLAIKQSVERAHDIVYSEPNFSKGDPIFSLTGEYGFIYFLDGTLPAWGWYNEQASDWDCVKIKTTQLKNLEKTIFILPVNYNMDSVYRSCLNDINIH